VTEIKHQGNSVWLELDDFYPPPNEQPNTVFKSMSIVFRALGSDTTYVDLMGVSAAAFRLQVGGALCPSSPHPYLGFSCATLARESLGFEFFDHSWEPANEPAPPDVIDAVVSSIDDGKPVLTAEEETGIVVGYEKNGKQLLMRNPYSSRGDKPRVLKNWPWRFGILVQLPKQPSIECITRSLETAVMLAHNQQLLEDVYASGFTAYQRWIDALSDESFIHDVDIDAGAIVLGNAHIYYCLVDARRCAAQYLRNILTRLPEAARERLAQAASLYDDVASRLDVGWANVPWPRQLRDMAEWTMVQRRSQASLLNAVREVERQAVGELEAALGSLPT
jgi:hypothetical protein